MKLLPENSAVVASGHAMADVAPKASHNESNVTKSKAVPEVATGEDVTESPPTFAGVTQLVVLRGVWRY